MQIADVKMRGQFRAEKWGQFCRNIQVIPEMSTLLTKASLSPEDIVALTGDGMVNAAELEET